MTADRAQQNAPAAPPCATAPRAEPSRAPSDAIGIYLALGSNLGDRAATIHAALRDLQSAGDIRVRRVSSLHETEPVGGPPGQGRYLNAVAEIETSLSPHALLERLLAVERDHGRRRTAPDGPRTLDLDLLLYGRRRIEDERLTVPHPRMWRRDFVLRPLGELCDVEALRAALGEE